MIAIGERFTVSARQQIKTEKGRVLATYLPDPGFDYAVTPRNREFVAGLIASGKAALGSRAAAAGAARQEAREAERQAKRDARSATRGGGTKVEARAPAGKLRGSVRTGKLPA